mgnify:CR=1 FL=1
MPIPTDCREIQFCELGLFIWIDTGFNKDFPKASKSIMQHVVNDSLGFSKIHSEKILAINFFHKTHLHSSTNQKGSGLVQSF